MRAFLYAARGLAFAVKNERNMRVHLCFAFYVIAAGFVTKLTAAEWAAVLICIALVTAAECVNTALEKACDAVTREKSESIRAAKDAAAGAVLVCAVFSAAAGCLIFFRREKLSLAWDFFQTRPVTAAVIIALLIPWCVFIFRKRKRNDK